MKKLFLKYREIITYVIFGAATTLVNFVSFWLLQQIVSGFEYSYLINNAAAWLISVVFAYVTNKLFVFSKKSFDAMTVIKELSAFLCARVFSFALEEGGLWLFVDVWGFSSFSRKVFGFNVTGELIAKLVLAVIVVILNYFFSKFFIFKKKSTSD